MLRSRRERVNEPERTEPRTMDAWSMAALSTVTKLSNIIGFLPINLDEILKAVVNETHALFAPQVSSVYMIGPGGELELAAFRSGDGNIPDVHVRPFADACSALRDGLPHIGCSAECRNRRWSAESSSHVCIPLTTGSDVNGVLSVTLKEGTTLSRDHLNVLLSIANQVSAAIQRHRLFEKLSSEKKEIERAYDEISGLNSLLTGKIEELRTAQNRLIQSEKIAVTGELAAGLCHEINNPISIILNRIECLKMEADDLALTKAVLKDLDVIYTHAAKVSSLVQDLLVFSRHHPVEMRTVNLATLMDRVLSSLQGMLRANSCRVSVRIPASLSHTQGDQDRLEQVFRNLIANAVDAMPWGGDINVEAERDPEDAASLVVRVHDEGEGIAEENIGRIFDPFFTTKKLGKGSGLGLSISYGIIKSHGGDIRVTSAAGQGCTFSVTLPLKERPGA